MGLIISKDRFNDVAKKLNEKYEIYAPVNLKGRKGTFSDTDAAKIWIGKFNRGDCG